jgi:hypothetical protein
MTQNEYLVELVNAVNEYAKKSEVFKNVPFTVTADEFTPEEVAFYRNLKEKSENAWWEAESHPSSVELARKAKEERDLLNIAVACLMSAHWSKRQN